MVVKTVSKITVSDENSNLSEGSVERGSLRQAKSSAAIETKRNKMRVLFMGLQR